MGHIIRILVTEDDAVFCRPLAEYLRINGYAVLCAADGGEAMARMAEADMLLLDLCLPGKSGFEVLAYARLFHPRLPVIVMSGRYSPTDAPKIEALGASGFLSKPFNPEDLLVLLNKAVPSPDAIEGRHAEG